MINEVFDEEVGEDEVLVIGTPAEVVSGDFVRNINGRLIGFKSPTSAQFHGWKRYRKVLTGRYNVLKGKAQKNPDLESLQALSDLAEKFDLATLEFVESLIVNPEDAEFIAMSMINGSVTIADLHNVLFNDEAEPEDDQDAPKKPAKKAVSNAKRTRK